MHRYRAYWAILLLFFSGLSHAAVVSGNHRFGSGRTVNLSNLYWMTLDQAQVGNLSVVEMQAAFNDSSSEFHGWRYASRAEGHALLNSLYTGAGYNVFRSGSYDGASWFRSEFGNPQGYIDRPELMEDGFNISNGWSSWNFAYAIGDCKGKACKGGASVTEISHGADENTGWFGRLHGLTYDSRQWTYETTESLQQFDSHMLVRTTLVPIPAAAWLFGSGLVGLGWFRRKKAV